MKKLCILTLISLCAFCHTAQAQTFNEWFKQKKTQIRYLGTQIAELKIYLNQVKKGYEVISGGLNIVRDIKNGEFTLHDVYYTSLGLVNSRIRNSPKARGILAHQLFILKASTALKNLLRTDQQLPDHHKTYITQSIGRLLDDLEKVRKELVDVTTDNTLELTDDQRLERVDALYQRSMSQFVFFQQFSGEVLSLIESLQRDAIDSRRLKQLHDLR